MTRQTTQTELAVNASKVRKTVRAMRTGSAAGKDRIRELKLKRKAEEGPGFLAGVYTMWLTTGKVSEKLKASRSLFLPKGTTDLDNIATGDRFQSAASS